MHVLKLPLRLLRPQRRRVILLAVLIFAAAIVEIVLLPGLVAGLFRVLSPEEGALEARYEFLRPLVARLDRLFVDTPEARRRALLVIAALTVLTALLRAGLTYSRIYLGQYIGGRLLVDLRMRLFERLQHLSLSFYESTRVGDLMSRLTTDLALVQQLVTADMTSYVTAPAIVLGGLGVMFWLNWKLTLVVVIFSPLISYVVARTGQRIKRLTTAQQERIADLNARLHERLAAMRIIQSFTRERYEIEHFRRLNENAFDAIIRVARVSTFAPQTVEFLALSSFVVVMTFAGLLIINEGIPLSKLMMYITLTQRVGVYLRKFGSLHLRVQQALGALTRAIAVSDRKPDLVERPDAAPLPAIEGRVALRSATFRYSEGDAVLTDVNLDIAPGEVIALVGPSGAGKTSLANLIMRFYDTTEGSVEVDGFDVRDVTLHSLRSQIGLVPQETVLFGGTIKENILYGRADATDAEVVEAARAANAHGFIAELEDGYDTEVGERGTKLSGGQRQRIAIARALLKDPRILILDEATSSLDAESEALVQEALERLMDGRTTLVIAHRLSTIRRADRILVLSDGRIVEEGAHEELLAKGGAYSRLYSLQQEGDERQADSAG